MKVISKTKAEVQKLKFGLFNEVLMLKQVDHPNVVKLLDLYED